MKLKITSFFLFFFLNVYGQSSDLLINNNSYKQGLSYDELNTACKKYIEMMETETYQLYEEKTKTFAIKMNNTLINAPSNFWDKNAFLKWLKSNIKNTQFKTTEEAEAYIDDMTSVSDKMIKENKELYDMISRATKEQIIKIRKPFFFITKYTATSKRD